MAFSPEDQEKVLTLAAGLLVDELRKSVDLADLITLPIDAVAPVIGLGPKQAARVLPTRKLGVRKLGVSLRALINYQAARSA